MKELQEELQELADSLEGIISEIEATQGEIKDLSNRAGKTLSRLIGKKGRELQEVADILSEAHDRIQELL